MTLLTMLKADTGAEPLPTLLRPRTAAEHLVDSLIAEGVEAVFGVPGGHISSLTKELRRRQAQLPYFMAHHEGGAAFMADGYARAGGGLGVVAVTAGPGATNAITGVASAQLDNVPLLLISGQTATDRFGLSAIQESTSEHGINTVEMLRHCTASSTLVSDVRSFPRLLARALRTARARPSGAVHLCLPANLGEQEVPAATPLPGLSPPRQVRGAANVHDVRAALDLLLGARRPLLYLGSGAREALSQLHGGLASFVEALALPVVTSPRAKGIFDECHLLSLGVYGIAGSSRADSYLEQGVDVLLVIGSRLGEWSSKGFSAALLDVPTMVQVDVRPAHIGQSRDVQLPVVADAHAFLQQLLDVAGARQLAASRQREERQRVLLALQALPRPIDEVVDDDTFKPQHLMQALEQQLTPDTDLYIDMGNCTAWAGHYLNLSPPARVFIPCGLSSMGWSCGAVIGGKIARPERTAIALVGDGAFLMNGAEVGTAARYRIGTVTVVLQDNMMGTVNHGERATGEAYPLDDRYFSLGSPGLEAFADALGAHSYSVKRVADLADALATAIQRAAQDRQPQVVVAHIDPRVVPPYGDRFKSVAASERRK